MEEKEADALEVAEKAHEEGEKIKETAQGWIKIKIIFSII